MGTVPLLTFMEFMWLSNRISLILSILSLGRILTRSHIRLPSPGSLPLFPQALIRSPLSLTLLHLTFLAICQLGCIFHLAVPNCRVFALFPLGAMPPAQCLAYNECSANMNWINVFFWRDLFYLWDKKFRPVHRSCKINICRLDFQCLSNSVLQSRHLWKAH